MDSSTARTLVLEVEHGHKMTPILQGCCPVLDVPALHLQPADQRSFTLVHQLVNATVPQQQDP